MKSFRSKPIGWRNDSYRHYLAAKGIATKKHPYVTTNDLKRKTKEAVKIQFHPREIIIPSDKNEQKVAEAIYTAILLRRQKKEESKKKVYAAAKEEVLGTVHGVKITAERIPENMVYVVTPEEIKKVISRMPKEDVKGLQSIELVAPQGEQKNAWGQYVRSRRSILIFAQPHVNGQVDGRSPEAVKQMVKSYVLPHEVGHHKALYTHKITDKSLAMAEARADANVVGMAPNDRDVYLLKR